MLVRNTHFPLAFIFEWNANIFIFPFSTNTRNDCSKYTRKYLKRMLWNIYTRCIHVRIIISLIYIPYSCLLPIFAAVEHHHERLQLAKIYREITFEMTDQINSPNNAQFRDRYELCKSTCLHCTCTCGAQSYNSVNSNDGK